VSRRGKESVFNIEVEGGHLDTTVVDHVKLVRNLSSLRFEGRIHEQILSAIRRAGGAVEWTDLYVVHTGYDHTPAGQERKRERDLRLLHLDLQERPGHPFALFNLGMTYTDLRRYSEGADFLRQCLRAADPGESHVRKAYALLVFSLMQMERPEEALTECDRALGLFPEDLELTFRRALLFQRIGRKTEAIGLYQTILTHSGPRHFTSVDRSIGGYKARQNLAVLHAELGHWDRALEQWKLITDEVPEYRLGWRGYGEQLLQLEKIDHATALSDHLIKQPRDAIRSEGWLLRGRIRIRCGDRPAARAAWEQAVSSDPHDAEPHRELARVAYAAGEWASAESSLRAAAALDVADARVWHNLGATLLNLKRDSEAADALRESLRLRVGCVETEELLRVASGG